MNRVIKENIFGISPVDRIVICKYCARPAIKNYVCKYHINKYSYIK